MKVALIADTHLGARSDNQFLLDYFEKFFSDVFFPYLDKHKIDTVIHLGDTFDRRKYVNYVTLQRAKRMLFDPLRDRNITSHFIIGNHDTSYRNTNSINSPSLLLKEYGFEIYERPTYLKVGCLDLLLLPWITAETRDESAAMIQEAKAKMILGHLEIQGFQMVPGHVCDYADAWTADGFQAYHTVMSGHFHIRATQKGIMYLGCPYEINWSDYGNQKGFHVLDTQTSQIEFIPNPHKLFHRIVYDDTVKLPRIDTNLLENCYVKVVVRNKTNPYEFDKLIDKINKAKACNVLVTEEKMSIGSGDSVDGNFEIEDTWTFIKNYIQNMDNVDSAGLTSLMSELYQQANELEV